ncbi:MAG: hypothetical protein H0X36_05645 [Sphingomonadaceae bacterium]|nr:hypothetical protein [Sphingomonadaceae bacterium]
MATILATRLLSAERRFFLTMAVIVLGIVFIGFAPSFYLRGVVPPYAPFKPTTPLVIVHGMLFTGWTLLFMTQVGLVSAGRVDLHRKLGAIGIFVLAAMIVVGMLSALNGVARHSGPPMVPPLAWLAIPFFDVPMFGTLIGVALYNRRNPQTHKRLMLIAMFGMCAPAIGRTAGAFGLPGPVFVVPLLVGLVTMLALWDRSSRGSAHRATKWGGSFLIGSWLFRLVIMWTPPWLAFAAWASGLVA